MDKEALEKALAEMKEALKKAQEEKSQSLQKSHQELVTAYEAKIKELEDKIAELEKKGETVMVTKDEFDKQMAAVEALAKKTKSEMARRPSFGESMEKALTEQKDNLVAMKNGTKSAHSFEVKDVTTASITMEGTTLNPGIATQLVPGVITPERQLHVRNVIPTGTMSGAAVYYVRQNSWTPKAGYQAGEGATKTRVAATLKTYVTPAVTIAAILKVSRQAMDDIPFLASYLNTQAPEELMEFEDAEVLYGDGATNHLEGLFTAASAATPNANDDNQYDTILTALKQLAVDSRITASGVLINSGDFFDILKLKDNTGAYLFPNFMINGSALRVGGIPVLPMTAVNANDFLAGNFPKAAQLLFREGINVRIFEQNDTDVEDNLLTIRVEERLALPIYRPYALLKGDLVPAT